VFLFNSKNHKNW
jgi:hypothetical protein